MLDGRFKALSQFTFRLDARCMFQYQRSSSVQFYELPQIAEWVVHGGLLHGALELV